MRFSHVLVIVGVLLVGVVPYTGVQSVEVAANRVTLDSHSAGAGEARRSRKKGRRRSSSVEEKPLSLLEEAQRDPNTVFDISSVTFDAGMVPEKDRREKMKPRAKTIATPSMAAKRTTSHLDDNQEYRFQQVDRKGGKGGAAPGYGGAGKPPAKSSKGGAAPGYGGAGKPPAKSSKGGSSKGGAKASKKGGSSKKSGKSSGKKGGKSSGKSGKSSGKKGGKSSGKGGKSKPKPPAGAPAGQKTPPQAPTAPPAPKPPPPPPVPTIPTMKDTRSYSDKVACVGCKYLWEKIHMGLDQSSGYDAVRDSFERTCAGTVDLFYDACDEMFDQVDELIQDYLAGSKFCDMCKRAQICPLSV